jgi:hypothetical protein
MIDLISEASTEPAEEPLWDAMSTRTATVPGDVELRIVNVYTAVYQSKDGARWNPHDHVVRMKRSTEDPADKRRSPCRTGAAR